MHRIAFAFAVVVALVSAARAELPPDGVLVAAQAGPDGTDDETLTIYRIKPSGMDKVHESTFRFGRKLAWADANTLWTLGQDGASSTVERIVDGKVAETIKAGLADWKLKSLREGDVDNVELLLTKNGQVWLGQCLKHKFDDEGGDKCLKNGFLRVDAKPFIASSKRPKNVRTYTPLAFPKMKAPAGYSVKLGKIMLDGKKRAGATCTGPAGSASFPDSSDDADFSMKPSKVAWLRASPAVVRINGWAIDPIGRRDYGQAFFVDCKRVQEVEYFDRGVWGVYRESERGTTTSREWTLYNDDKVIGTLATKELEVAPR